MVVSVGVLQEDSPAYKFAIQAKLPFCLAAPLGSLHVVLARAVHVLTSLLPAICATGRARHAMYGEVDTKYIMYMAEHSCLRAASLPAENGLQNARRAASIPQARSCPMPADRWGTGNAPLLH